MTESGLAVNSHEAGVLSCLCEFVYGVDLTIHVLNNSLLSKPCDENTRTKGVVFQGADEPKQRTSSLCC